MNVLQYQNSQWASELYQGIASYGNDKWVRRWFSSISFGLGDYYSEGMSVLDYGSGSAIYAGFLSRYLREFDYYGVEKGGGEGKYGETVLESGRVHFGHDHRVKLGYIGGSVEREGIERADCAILASVFTHIPFKEFEEINDKLMPIVKRGGCVTFSVFLGEEEMAVRNGRYGFEGCYGSLFYKEGDILQYCDSRGIKCELMDEVKKANKPFIHSIYRLTRKKV